MTTLIAIGHTARAGKDSAANALVRDLGYKKISFADPLRRLALLVDPMIYPQTPAVNMAPHNRLAWVVQGSSGWEASKDRWPEVRRILQNLGVGCREVFGEDVWVKLALDVALGHDKVVIADCRFLNEAEEVKWAGGFLVKIDRPGYAAGSHISETELADFDGWDLTIDNSSTIPELEASIVKFAKGLERR